MKKLLIIVAIAVVSLSFAACDNSHYREQGKQYAKRLQELCEKNDTAAAVALDDSIRAIQAELRSKGDTANLKVFNEAFGDVRQQFAPFITVSKMSSGTPKDDAVQDVVDDALSGQGDIESVTSSIDAALEKEGKKTESPKRAN